MGLNIDRKMKRENLSMRMFPSILRDVVIAITEALCCVVLVRALRLSSEQCVIGSGETGNVECLKAGIYHENGSVNTCGTQ